MSRSTTIRRREVRVPDGWPDHVHPVLRRVYAARGVTELSQVRHRLGGLLPPTLLGGLDRAVELLAEAIARDLRICVIGDFDADGATGTAVAVRGLRLLGARDVRFRVPHRLTHGYGLSPALVADLADISPDLLVTVDSGIACVEGVAAARAAGMRVIVTDHHLPGAMLPEADAIVNPNLRDDGFPSKSLAGVGVMFYLLLALRAHLRLQGKFSVAEPDLSSLLDLVAVGTVADMVSLDENNRILVAAGLKRMRAGLAQPGLRALLQVAGRPPEKLGSADLGFALGPRINAAGRLEDMALGIECLLADDQAAALRLATQLDAINRERRDLQGQMLQQAEAMAAGCIAVIESGGMGDAALCVFDADWHPGVVGLVASRLKERVHRPTIAFAPGGEDGFLRGSARSIPGFHIRDALADVAAMHPGLIARFGGHAMAAGLSLAPENLEAFRVAFIALAAERLDAGILRAELLSDGALAAQDLSRDLAEQLRDGGPWGQGFPEPVFDDEFTVTGWRVVGSGHLKMQLRHAASGAPIDAIHFSGFDGTPPASRVHLAYQLETDDFRDRCGVQLLVRHRVDVG
ncbi:single-stranded-DNA-specific exonuclease RecJ [Xanthomonadaceae bacterium JHOS43]|nr:single-stranded-DNA-specific exonuclease RecJ [Xanthomonadaceae bacterium JHOS43]